MCTRVANKMRLNLQYDEGGGLKMSSAAQCSCFLFFVCFLFCFLSAVRCVKALCQEQEVTGLGSHKRRRNASPAHKLCLRVSCPASQKGTPATKLLPIRRHALCKHTHGRAHRTHDTTRHTGRATRDKTFHNSRQVFLGGGGLRHNHPVCMSCVNVTKNVEKNASG